MALDPKMFTTRVALERLSLGALAADMSDWMKLPPRPPLTRWQRIRSRVKRASWAVRWWIAEKVLRLPVGDE